MSNQLTYHEGPLTATSKADISHRSEGDSQTSDDK
jgi:hypothetical protein